MTHYYKNALLTALCGFLYFLGYIVSFEALTLGYALMAIASFLLIAVFFNGISDSVKDGIERAKKEEKKTEK